MPSPEEVAFSMSLAGTGTSDKASPRGRQLHTSDGTERPVPPRRATRSSSKRRSVSNMKGLMPLSLSPSYSPSSVPTEGSMEQRMDGYFPEVLARDLEHSTDLFAAKNMTAGTPATVLPAGDKTRRKHKSCPTRPSQPMRHYSASARVQSLGAIQERNVIVSFLNHQQRKVDDTTSDIESISGTDTSGGVAPPSFRYREQSFTTAATSLTSASGTPSSKNSPVDGPRELSWIEIDSDEEEEQDPTEETLEALAPRPQTPPEPEVTAAAATPVMEPRAPWNCNNPLHHKSHSVGAGAPITLPIRHSSKQGTDLAMGRSFSARGRGNDRREFRRSQTCSPTRRSTPLNRIRALHSREGIEEEDTNTYEKTRIVLDTTALSDDCLDTDEDEEEDDYLANHPSWKRPSTVYIRPSPPPSPLPSVQAWLNNSVRPYTPGLPNDDLSRAVPLPPDVIETLRVSIACFPETMLLSSSLTVETIRTYSRKVRHPNLDLRDLPDESPLQSARRSIWRRVVSYKRGSAPSDHQRPRDSQASNQSSLPSSASSNSLEAPPPWMPLKHVFGCCSDYICDALYAHIVAYNYISALVPRNTSQLKPGHKPTPSNTDTQKEDIPKKAASLLGLSGPSNGAGGPGAHRLLPKKLSMARLSWGPGKDMTAGQQAMSAAQEHTARDIQAGLMRCIVRLVATAKLMAESGTGEEMMVEMDPKEVDVLFTRSLCEIVRISEDVV